MKRALIIVGLAVVFVIGAFIGYVDGAFASGHTLVVDGLNYDSTKEAGDSIHWETPGSNPLAASFAERGQTWAPGDNGSDHLPCPGGIHWISNENVLTVSGCLEGPEPSTTTIAPTTTSSTSAPTTTSPGSTTTLPAETTTVPEMTSSTSSPALSTEPSTTAPSQSTTQPSSAPSTTLTPTPTGLPKTGVDTGLLAVWAAAFLLLGLALLAARRAPH